MVEWVDIKGYENKYAISNEGYVKNVKTGKILKPGRNKKGYLQVCLYKNGKHTCKIHRLVANHFLPDNNGCKQINHIDNNKENNNVNNLEWCDCQYNIDYTLSKKVFQYTTEGMIIHVWKSCSEAGRYLNKNPSLICRCCKGKCKTAYGYVWKYTNGITIRKKELK